MRLDQLPPFPHRATLRVVVETPRGSRNKYAYDPALDIIVLSKSLPEGMVFPRDFGFIPRTRGADGDPLDALVLLDAPAVPGCVIDCRLVGVIEAQQSEEGKMVRNDRFIAIAAESLEFRGVRHWRQVPSPIFDQIGQFFENYHRLRGGRFKALRTAGPVEARKLIERQRVPAA